MPEFEVIGVLSLPDRVGTGGFEGYRRAAERDLLGLQDGGVDTILIENSGETATSRLLPENVSRLMKSAMRALKPSIRVPFLVGALPVDFSSALDLAKDFGGKGIWMDTLVDRVSPKYLGGDLEIALESGHLDYLRLIKDDKLVYAEVQPRNFYRVLDNRPLIESVRRVKEHADALCIVGENGPPGLDLVRQVRDAAGKRIGVSGGLNAENIGQYVGTADFGVVFSSIRYDGKYDEHVDPHRVGAFMDSVRRVA